MIPLLTSLWLAASVLTFVPPADQFILVDETGQLDAQVVQEAAESLTEQGAIVAVFVVMNVTPATTFDRLLTDYGLLNGSTFDANAIAIFINSSDNTTEIRYGAKWRRAIGDKQASIYSDRLAPGVMTGAYNAGVINTLNEIDYITEQNSSADSPPLPPLSTGILVIFAVGLVLVSFISWVFMRQPTPHGIHSS